MTNDLHELAAGFALDALDEDEHHAFEEHLASCAVCEGELASLHDAAAALAHDVYAPAPPAELRDRVLRQVRRERTNVVRLRPRWQWPVAGVAAVAAGAAIGFGIWAFSESSSLDRERAARRADAQALAIVAAPGSIRFPLYGATGALVVARSGEAALVVSGLRPAPAGKTYEVWVVRGGPPQPAGIFAGGSGRLVVALKRAVPHGARVAVSIERAGGSEKLTGSMLFGAQTA
jgi:anti-sigma-K factor RskA